VILGGKNAGLALFVNIEEMSISDSYVVKENDLRGMAGRSDGVNGSYLGKRIRYVCGSLITVHRLKHFVFCHERNSSYYSSLYLTRRLSAL